MKSDGLYLVNKPLGWTSFQAVKKIRRILQKKLGMKLKVGHAGTLDPLATGLLIICSGKMTKKINEFQTLKKEYTGTFFLGATTPSFDLETPIDESFPVNHINTKQLYEAAIKLTGNLKQIPPDFSAKWVLGERAYHKARRGEKMELKPKEVIVYSFEILTSELPLIDFKIVCSSGTYIRALARDFGELLGSGAHLTKLCRTKIGEYSLLNSIKIDYDSSFDWNKAMN